MEEEAARTTRLLSRHERYSLVRRRIGTPSVLTYVATFDKNATSVPTLQDLKTRMALLVQQYPNLRCRVNGASSSKPILQSLPLDEAIVSSQVVEKTVRGDQEETTAQAIFKECLAWSDSMDPAKGDLWKIGRIVNEINGEVAIVLSADHIIGDGRGTLALFSQLISPSTSLSEPVQGLAPTLEEKVNIKPALTTLAKVIIQALLVPKLPTWLVPDFLVSKPFWPFEDTVAQADTSFGHKSALQAEIGILVGAWSANQVKRIRLGLEKTAPKATLHSIICACAMSALWITEATSSDDAMGRDMRIKLTSPTSERDKKLGHPDILGNYVGTVDTEIQVSPSQDFASIVSHYSTELRRQVDSKSPPTAWGLLDYIDDSDISNSESGLNGWETFFLEKATAKEPFSGSIEVSNLGLAPVLEHGVQKQTKRIDWMQTPTAIGAAMTVNVVGCRSTDAEEKQGDLSFSITWRKDSVAGNHLSESRIGNFKKVLEALPDIIAQEQMKGGSLILKDLREASKSSLSLF